ncbi:hypothetical protein H2199_004395 [Coniosporium tulheliwenetii]|uniref:Uncharacterized protein n=1 Tax=Coniosporium tulheliwenetii TaxID=3383036 RepID=A0ACC2Z5F4_9PEZI|nr:hypothetical protein H2199_004395 [Cladosporium sp. JES 115]
MSMPASTPPSKGHRPRRQTPNGSLSQSMAAGELFTGAESHRPPSSSRTKKQHPRRPKDESLAIATPSTTDGRSSPLKDAHRQSQSGSRRPSATPARRPEYAGPTFHASPAPSALPIPKFFSKSVPTSSSQKDPQSQVESESDTSDKSQSPPSSDVAPARPEPPPREESPLDIFFKADREEKAKRLGSNGFFTPSARPAPMVFSSEPPRPSISIVPGRDQRHHSRHSSTHSGKGMFMMELDGSGTEADLNGFLSKPYSSSRLPSSRSTTAPSSVPYTSTVSQDKEATAQALKDMLFSMQPENSQRITTPPAARTPSNHASGDESPSPFYRPASAQHSARGPSTPAPQSNQSTDLSFHYGNRNLSPLFHAAMTDPVRRPSSLRKELDPSSPVANRGDPAELHLLPSMPLTTTRPESISKPDASAISLNCLNSHIQAAAGGLPDHPLFQPPQHPPSPFRDQTHSGTTSQSHDIKAMEADLKRLLNLSVLGGAAAASVR